MTATPAAEPEDEAAARAEAIREAATREAPKHKRLLRSARDGRILSAMMLPLFLLRPPTGFALLSTTGRKTGKTRSRCIRATRRGDRVYIVQLRPPELAMARPTSVAGWVWNIRHTPRVTLRMRGGTFTGVARELTDPTELARAREAVCTTVNRFDYGECVVHLRGRPTRAKVEQLHRYWFDTGITIVVELTERA